MKSLSALLTLCCLLLVEPNPARAWEPATTHAGLTERAALEADLHKVLHEAFAAETGLYSPLTIPKADAPALFALLKKLNPTHGYTPDETGTMSALSWLVAGAVLADIPNAHASNHFFDPSSEKGLSNRTATGTLSQLSLRIHGAKSLSSGGASAKQWWKSESNGLGYPGFAEQFRKSVASGNSSERNRHLAGSLLAAGAMLHVLQDMGSPSHVRNDIAAHQEQISEHKSDLGSRFEHIAALAFGRLGIPKASQLPALPSLQAHFSNGEKTGLANIIEENYFSSNTLPSAVRAERGTGASVISKRVLAKLSRPHPSPKHAQRPIDSIAAQSPQGATWRNDKGICLAQYRWQQGLLKWSIDDTCALQQLEAILPQVAAFSVSFLRRLYPTDLNLQRLGGKLKLTASTRYGKGTLRVYADDKNGIRTEIHAGPFQNGAPLSQPPRGTARITVLFDGTDTLGESLLSTASISLSQ